MNSVKNNIDILFSLTPVTLHKDLLDDVYKHLNAFIPTLMEAKFSFKKNEYSWILAGGFSSFIQGRTTEYGDIDVYIISRRVMPIMYALKIQLSKHEFDIFVVSQNFTNQYPKDFNCQPFEKYCAILCEFDLDICRSALIDGGTRILNVFYDDIHHNVHPSFERVSKYRNRINKFFEQDENNWKPMKVRRIYYGDSFFYYKNNPIHPIFQDICKTISVKYNKSLKN